MNYSTPTVVRCGKSEELIQGECGFGFENLAMDKTGTTKKNVRQWVQVLYYPQAIYQCQTRSSCSDSDEC